MLESLLLSAALAEARDVLDRLRRAEARLLLSGQLSRQLGLAELRAAIAKLDKGIQQAQRYKR